MKRFVFAAAILLCLLSCGRQGKMTVTLTNTLNLVRENETVTLNWEDIVHAIPHITPENVVVTDVNGTQVTSQTTPSNQEIPDVLLFQANVGANSNATYIIKKGKREDYSSHAHCRIDAEQDAFIWENNRILFKLYGHSKGDSDKSLGIYLDNYESPEILGCGALAPYADGKLWLHSTFDSCEVIDNGPLRVSARLVYNAIPVKDKTVKMVKTISLDANSYLTFSRTTFHGDFDTLEVASGLFSEQIISETKTNRSIYFSEWTSFCSQSDAILHLAISFLNPNICQGIDVDKHSALLTSVTNGQTVMMVSGGAWNKGDIVITYQDWEDYLILNSIKYEIPLVKTFN